MREDGENPFDGLGCTSINRCDMPFGNRTLHGKAIGNLFERVFEGVRCGPGDFLWTIQTTEWLTDDWFVSRLYHLLFLLYEIEQCAYKQIACQWHLKGVLTQRLCLGEFGIGGLAKAVFSCVCPA